MEEIPDGSVDMILCDLPYGTTNISWDKVIPYDRLWAHYERIIKDDGAICLFSAQPFTTDLINSNRKLFRYEIIWEKTIPTGFLDANRRPMRSHENILIFGKKLPIYYPVKYEVDEKPAIRRRKDGRAAHYKGAHRGGVYVSDGTRYPRSVVCFSNSNIGSKHPTQKPVKLLEYLILTYSKESETVLDNAMGAGSTGVACVNTNRNFIGYEIDEEYFKIAKERIEKARAQGQLFL